MERSDLKLSDIDDVGLGHGVRDVRRSGITHGWTCQTLRAGPI